MAFWLFKEEPNAYLYADLERDGKTVWEGVSNALARQNLRKVEVGDHVFFYSTGKVKAVTGEIRIVSGPVADPTSDDDKAIVVEVEPVRPLAKPVTLAQIKDDPGLSDWELVRLPRLSVLPVTEHQWKRVHDMGK